MRAISFKRQQTQIRERKNLKKKKLRKEEERAGQYF
jgi:hypothetical protein